MNYACGYLAANIRVAANLRVASEREEWKGRWGRLQLRAETIGASLAGQNNDEGVIDEDGNFHDVEWDTGDSEEFRLAAISAVLERLGA